MPSISGIYEIRNKINGKVYIGSSLDIYDRWSTHKRLLRNGKHHAPHLQNAWNAYGSECFEFCVIEICSKDLLIKTEQHYIDTMRPVYNVSPTAGSPRGHRHTKEAIEKITAASRNMSDETKRKISLAGIGRVFSEEVRAKISASMKGKNTIGHKPSEQAIQNMRKAQKGHSVSAEQKEKIRKANTGKKKSKEAIEKLSNSLKEMWKRKKQEKHE